MGFRPGDLREAYAFVRRVLVRFRYAELPKAGKEFPGEVTGLSRAQLTRLVGQHARTGTIEDRRRGPARPFERRYTATDTRLLAEVDEILGELSGPTTRRVRRREFEEYGRQPFERLARQQLIHRRLADPSTLSCFSRHARSSFLDSCYGT